MAQLPRPAAVFVAAGEDDDDAWAEALEVDDSDLRLGSNSSSRPLRPSTASAPYPERPSRLSHGQRIPGPASAVQDAVRLRVSGTSPALGRVDIQAADADFMLPPWLRALRFLGKDCAWERPGIKRIKADEELHRAPLVVGVVTSCKPNGLGDLFLTLKDPTDTIGATVHRKVLSEGKIAQDISVGCVILLNKVAVFRPSHSTCYLNITKGKVAKVLRNDCDSPLKQEISFGTNESQLPVTWTETQWVAHLGDRPLGTSERTPSIFSKMVSMTEGDQVADLHSKGYTANNSANQQSPKTSNSKNIDPWHQRRGSLCMFERGEDEVSGNIMMRQLGHEKMMLGRKEIAVAEVSYHHQRTLDSSKSTSVHKWSSCTDGHPQKSFNIPNTCAQPVPGVSSVIRGDRACTQAGNNEKLRLPRADEIMLPRSKKLKTNAALLDCYDTTFNTSLDSKSKHGLENGMGIDMLNMAEPFHGGHFSTGKPDEHQQKDFCARSTGTAPPTKETSATDAGATNNGSFLSHPKSVISVATLDEWTDEQVSELFTDY